MFDFILMKNVGNVSGRNRGVVSLSGQLIVDRNEKVVGDKRWVSLRLCRGLDDEGGQDGDEQCNLCSSKDKQNIVGPKNKKKIPT